MRVIGWTYEADYHCEPCTKGRLGDAFDGLDARYDRESNEVRPVFSTDERLEPICCGDCGEELE